MPTLRSFCVLTLLGGKLILLDDMLIRIFLIIISVSHQQSPLALGGRRSGQDTPLKNHTNPPFAADASLVLASFGEFLLQREMMMRRQNNYGAVLLWSERKRLGVFCAEKVVFRAFDDDTFREATFNSAGFSSTFFDLEFPSSQPS